MRYKINPALRGYYKLSLADGTVVSPGDVFELSEADAGLTQQYRRMSRKPVALLVKVDDAGGESPAPAVEAESETITVTDIPNLTKRELINLGQSLGVSTSGKTKTELKDLLVNVVAGKELPDDGPNYEDVDA